MLTLKFSQSGSRLRHELASYPTALRPSVRPRTARAGGIRHGGRRNEAGRRRGRQKIWKTLNSGLEVLQPLEIPQNRQSFLWKSLDENSLDLEKLARKLGGPSLFRRLCHPSPRRRAGRVSYQAEAARRLSAPRNFIALTSRAPCR